MPRHCDSIAIGNQNNNPSRKEKVMIVCRRYDRWRPTVIACTAIVLIGAAGSTGASGQDNQATTNGSPAAVVKMTDSFTFDPEKVTIEAGQTVKWVNDPSTILHTVTADPAKARNSDSVQLPEGAETFHSGEIQPGDVFTHSFTVPGRYVYFCIPHEQAGMVGEVEVQAAAQDEQSTDDAAPPVPKGGQPSQSSMTGEQAEEETTATERTDPTQDSDAAGDKTPDPTFVFGAHAAPRPPEYRKATGFWKFVYWLGNFHPAATDVPVGITLAAFLSEVLLLTTGKASFAIITRFCVWVAGIAALGTALLGWCLAGFQFYDNAWMLTTHRVLGTATGIWGLVLIATMEAARSKGSSRWRWTFRGVLLIGTTLIVVTGFFGGGMIYGLDHYDWPNAGNG